MRPAIAKSPTNVSMGDKIIYDKTSRLNHYRSLFSFRTNKEIQSKDRSEEDAYEKVKVIEIHNTSSFVKSGENQASEILESV